MDQNNCNKEYNSLSYELMVVMEKNRERTIFTVIVIILNGIFLFFILFHSWAIVLMDVNRLFISVQIPFLQKQLQYKLSVKSSLKLNLCL